jgi:hypothetical protein
MLWLDLSRCKVFEDRLIITEGLSSSTTISAGTLRPLRQLSAYRPSLFLNQTTDYSAELEAREEILARIMDLVKQLGIDFAFPDAYAGDRGTPQEDLPVARGALGAVLGRR